ncbi:MAG: hypothetical protein WA880_12435 [Ornithinimicrobium sp.]
MVGDDEEPLPLAAGVFLDESPPEDESLLDEDSLAEPDSAFLLPESPEEEPADSGLESEDPFELDDERPLEPVRESLR